MKVLILDDDPTRLSIFKRKLIGHSVVCTTTAEGTIEQLKENSFDTLFLDHDLGGKTFVTSGPGTGYEVSKWLEENPDKQPEQIFIHSYNAAGAANMKRALPKAIIAPGIWLA